MGIKTVRIFTISFLFAGLFLPVATVAKIVETTRMEEVAKLVDSDTLLIFDLDNTIVMPAQTLGGEEWFDYQFEKYQDANLRAGDEKQLAIKKALTRALGEWESVQKVTATVPVEATGPAVVSALQKKGARTLALTARPPSLSATTFSQLQSVGYLLWNAPFDKRAFNLTGTVPTRHEKSVVFVNALNSKGDVLVQFLERSGTYPKKIVFVDNKKKHVVAVEAALKAYPIEYIGCRHGASDAKIAAFDSQVADVQFQFFGKILDDASAKALSSK